MGGKKRKRIRTVISMTLWFVLLLVFIGCKKKQEPEGYRVVSFDRNKAEWTLIRTGTFDGKFLQKRLTLVCDFYQWGNREMIKGPTACDLPVGRLLVPNAYLPKEKRAEFLDIWEMSAGRLAITEGSGSDKVEQQFIIQKNEVLPDK
jgi:hypothetical protein